MNDEIKIRMITNGFIVTIDNDECFYDNLEPAIISICSNYDTKYDFDINIVMSSKKLG